jgi:hypothetical protein
VHVHEHELIGVLLDGPVAAMPFGTTSTL